MRSNEGICGMGEFILQVLAEAVFQLAGYATSWVVVPLFSLGRVVVEPKKRGVGVSPRWHHASRAADGTLIIDAETGSAIGIAFWILVAVVWYLARG